MAISFYTSLPVSANHNFFFCPIKEPCLRQEYCSFALQGTLWVVDTDIFFFSFVFFFFCYLYPFWFIPLAFFFFFFYYVGLANLWSYDPALSDFRIWISSLIFLHMKKIALSTLQFKILSFCVVFIYFFCTLNCINFKIQFVSL